MNAYETAGAYFGDVGSGVIGLNGDCKITLEDVFCETIALEAGFAVFLQPEGP